MRDWSKYPNDIMDCVENKPYGEDIWNLTSHVHVPQDCTIRNDSRCQQRMFCKIYRLRYYLCINGCSALWMNCNVPKVCVSAGISEMSRRVNGWNSPWSSLTLSCMAFQPFNITGTTRKEVRGSQYIPAFNCF